MKHLLEAVWTCHDEHVICRANTELSGCCRVVNQSVNTEDEGRAAQGSLGWASARSWWDSWNAEGCGYVYSCSSLRCLIFQCISSNTFHATLLRLGTPGASGEAVWRVFFIPKLSCLHLRCQPDIRCWSISAQW